MMCKYCIREVDKDTDPYCSKCYADIFQGINTAIKHYYIITYAGGVYHRLCHNKTQAKYLIDKHNLKDAEIKEVIL